MLPPAGSSPADATRDGRRGGQREQHPCARLGDDGVDIECERQGVAVVGEGAVEAVDDEEVGLAMSAMQLGFAVDA